MKFQKIKWHMISYMMMNIIIIIIIYHWGGGGHNYFLVSFDCCSYGKFRPQSCIPVAIGPRS